MCSLRKLKRNLLQRVRFLKLNLVIGKQYKLVYIVNLCYCAFHYLILIVYMFVWVCAYECTTSRVQKRASDLLELELRVSCEWLRTKLRPFVKAVLALNC